MAWRSIGELIAESLDSIPLDPAPCPLRPDCASGTPRAMRARRRRRALSTVPPGKRPRRGRSRSIHPRAETGPTPETAAKLRPDMVAALHRAGALDPDQALAAEAVRTLWAAMMPPLIGGRTYGLVAGGRSGRPVDPVGKLSGAHGRTWSAVWRPWAAEMGARTIVTRDGPLAIGQGTVLALVLDVVADNIAPTAAQLAALRAALDRWNAIARAARRKPRKDAPEGRGRG